MKKLLLVLLIGCQQPRDPLELRDLYIQSCRIVCYEPDNDAPVYSIGCPHEPTQYVENGEVKTRVYIKTTYVRDFFPFEKIVERKDSYKRCLIEFGAGQR